MNLNILCLRAAFISGFVNCVFFIFLSFFLVLNSLFCCCSVIKLCSTLCDPMDCSIPGFPVLHHSTISSSVAPPLAFSFSQHQSLFQWVSFLHLVAKLLELHLCLVWSPCCPGDFQDSSSAPQFESINSLMLSLLYIVQLLHPYMTPGKTIALIIWTLFNILSR